MGNAREAKRVMRILREARIPAVVSGYVGVSKDEVRNKARLGGIGQVEEVIKIYGINEVIFCSKDIPANQIIEWMTSISNKALEFKIAPDESNYIIGSQSKNKPGSFYTVNINLNILQQGHVRNKRLLDIVSSGLFLLFSPVLMWWTAKPANFIVNAFRVLTGKYSWVGLASKTQMPLPKVRKGILTPLSRYQGKKQAAVVAEEDMRYARDYNVFKDLRIIFSCFRLLGGQA